jgi:beta-glucosidase
MVRHSVNQSVCRALVAATVLLAGAAGAARAQQNRLPESLDVRLPFAVRADYLVAHMTLPEKVSQMMDNAAPIPRLGVPAYGWWNEALHGVARSGLATSFPQAIGMAATWDTTLIYDEGRVISNEARGKYNDDIAHDRHKHLPRPEVGPRAGNLRRGSLPHRAHRCAVHSRRPGQ